MVSGYVPGGVPAGTCRDQPVVNDLLVEMAPVAAALVAARVQPVGAVPLTRTSSSGTRPKLLTVSVNATLRPACVATSPAPNAVDDVTPRLDEGGYASQFSLAATR